MTMPTSTSTSAVHECPLRLAGITFTARRTPGSNRWQVFAGHRFTPVGYLEASQDPTGPRERILVFDAGNQPLGAGPAATYARALSHLHATLLAVAADPLAEAPGGAGSRT